MLQFSKCNYKFLQIILTTNFDTAFENYSQTTDTSITSLTSKSSAIDEGM